MVVWKRFIPLARWSVLCILPNICSARPASSGTTPSDLVTSHILCPANNSLLHDFACCYDNDPETEHQRLNWADCDQAITAMHADKDYTTNRSHWESSQPGQYRGWTGGEDLGCIVAIGCETANAQGRFYLGGEVVRQYLQMKIDCPKKGGKEYLKQRGPPKKGWYVEVYRPLLFNKSEESLVEMMKGSPGGGGAKMKVDIVH